MQAAGAVHGESRENDPKTSADGPVQGPALRRWFLLQVELGWLPCADPSPGAFLTANVADQVNMGKRGAPSALDQETGQATRQSGQ